MTRALASVGGWDQITHVGSNSGGNWFASQLFYSEAFYGNLTDTSVDLASFVTLWGAEYGQAMRVAVESGAVWATVFDVGSFSAAHPVCAATANFVEGIGPFLDDRDFPAWMWMPYVAAMLKPWIADVETATFGTRAMTGLTTATLLQQTTMAPDVYLDNDVLATRSITYEAGYAPNTTTTSYVLPIGHATPPAGGGSPGFLLNHKITSVTATRDERNAKPYSLVDPSRDPLVVEMSSASSAALGIMASPTMLEEWVPGSLHPLGACWPLGAETLGSPMLVDGYTLPTGEAALTATTDKDKILFRYMDGALADNSNAAMTLGRMQAECAAASGAGCEDGYRMIIACDDCQASLFMDPSMPPGTFIGPGSGDFGFNNPIPTIFAEGKPPDSAFTEYARCPDLYRNGSRSEATYWSGNLTTVNNEWYGVRGGDKVELLFLTGIWDVMAVAGLNAEQLFEKFYSQTAAAQADGAAPIISMFLEGQL